MADGPCCADQSRQVGERLCGTTPRVDAWFLLEYAGRWEPEPLDGSALPEPVQAHLKHHLGILPHARFGYIRRDPRYVPADSTDRLSFFVALPRESGPALYAFSLGAYDDLLSLDLPAICAGSAAYDPHRHTGPLFLVCTHGRRDVSCARYGRPAYEALAAHAGAVVWQTTHVGGHRLAANVVALPQGAYYGRVDPAQAPILIEAARAGQLMPDLYRGRVCYDPAVQAAEYYLRVATGLTAVEAFGLVGAAHDGDQWVIRFAALADAARHTLRLVEEQSPFQVYKNSGDDAPSHVPQFRLVRHTLGLQD